MKKFKSYILSAAMLAGSIAFTSCLSNNDNKDYVIQQQLNYCINAIFSSDDQVTYKQGVVYDIRYNYTTVKADLAIQNLSMPNQSYTTALKFENVPWSYLNNWKAIRLSNATPTTVGANVPTFNDFNLMIYDRYLSSGEYYPIVKINYTLGDGEYYVNSLPARMVCMGTTTALSADGTYYKQPDNDCSTYMVQVYNGDTTLDINNPEKRKASINIVNAKFAANMYGYNLLIQDLPYDVNRAGNVTIVSDQEITPDQVISSSSAVKLNNYKVSNLRCVVNPANYMNLTFTLTIKSDKDQSESKYDVQVQCETPQL